MGGSRTKERVYRRHCATRAHLDVDRVPSSSSKARAMTAQEPFAQSELALALSEQKFGIESYSMIMKSGTELEATAEVLLLEGMAVEVTLTSRGYQVSFVAFIRSRVSHTGRSSSSSKGMRSKCTRPLRMRYKLSAPNMLRPDNSY